MRNTLATSLILMLALQISVPSPLYANPTAPTIYGNLMDRFDTNHPLLVLFLIYVMTVLVEFYYLRDALSLSSGTRRLFVIMLAYHILTLPIAWLLGFIIGPLAEIFPVYFEGRLLVHILPKLGFAEATPPTSKQSMRGSFFANSISYILFVVTMTLSIYIHFLFPNLRNFLKSLPSF